MAISKLSFNLINPDIAKGEEQSIQILTSLSKGIKAKGIKAKAASPTGLTISLLNPFF
ncbi:hypothetical protein [Colwellia sp. 75C3]|uniref:hypothetical protein n=1 Tax=Colwellia sp. 75C3 TaxID=888425 RepID=UPI001E4C8388|nr:hypothetical protein [Colwellia sp. 75C3]